MNSQSAPIILVGTKKDLTKNESYLQDNGVRPVPTEDGNQAKLEYNCYAFVETSALTQDNLQTCFNEAIRAVLNKRDKDKQALKAGKKSGGFCSVL